MSSPGKKPIGKTLNLPIGSVIKMPNSHSNKVAAPVNNSANAGNSLLLPTHKIPKNNRYNHWTMQGRGRSRKVNKRKERKTRRHHKK